MAQAAQLVSRIVFTLEYITAILGPRSRIASLFADALLKQNVDWQQVV